MFYANLPSLTVPQGGERCSRNEDEDENQRPQTDGAEPLSATNHNALGAPEQAATTVTPEPGNKKSEGTR